MIPSLESLRSHRARLLEMAARRGARNLRVFGSVARGTADEASDIDFLVDLDPERSLLDLGALLVDLQGELDHEVDLVTEAGLRPRIRDRVLQEAVPL